MPLTANKPDLNCALQIATICSNSCLLRRVEAGSTRDLHLFLLLRYTCNMCLLFSRVCFREELREDRELTQRVSLPLAASIHKASVSLWNESIQLKTIAGTLSSLLHENYSVGELKECGVHSVEQLAEHHIHS